MKKLLREKQNADTECNGCGVLDTRLCWKLLALEVGARITSADQKCHIQPLDLRGRNLEAGIHQ